MDSHYRSNIRIGSIAHEDFLPSLVDSDKQLDVNWFHTTLLCHKVQMLRMDLDIDVRYMPYYQHTHHHSHILLS